MISIAVVDSGPLLAVANRSDPDHLRCRRVLERPTLRLVIPALCVAEVSHFLGRRQGAETEAAFLAGLEGFDVRAPGAESWPRIAELVRQYADFPLGGIDATVAALADELETDWIVTLDRRHFQAIRNRRGQPFHLLPEP